MNLKYAGIAMAMLLFCKIGLGEEKTASTRPHAVRTFTTRTDMINSVNLKLNPKNGWTDIQLEEARKLFREKLDGSKYESTAKVLNVEGSPEHGFSCEFSRTASNGKTERLSGRFDGKYARLIKGWRVGQNISFIGTVKDTLLNHSHKDPNPLSIDFRLVECVPKQ